MANKPKPQPIQSKKHLARQQREKKQRTYILIGSAIVFASIFGVLIYGLLNQFFLSDIRPVAIVNGEKITSSEFTAQTKFTRYNLIRQVSEAYQLSRLFLDNPAAESQFKSQVEEAERQLFPTVVGEQVLEDLITDKLISQELIALGIKVTEKEIEQVFEEAFGYYPGGTPTSQPTSEEQPTSTLSHIQLTLAPKTRTPSASPTLSTTTTSVISETASPTETNSTDLSFESNGEDSNSITDPLNTATQIPPTATTFTQEHFENLYKDSIANFKNELEIDESDVRYAVISQLYRQKLKDEIVGDIPCQEEQVWALHILVEGEETANDIVDRLNGGEDWTSLASEFSIDPGSKNNGGDLGWFGRGAMVPVFEDTAFGLEIGETSEPIQSNFGWHIVRNLGREERSVMPDRCDLIREDEFLSWLNDKRDNSEIEVREIWEEIVPQEPTLPPEIRQIYQQEQPPQLTVAP